MNKKRYAKHHKKHKKRIDPLFADCVPFRELKKQIKQEKAIENAGLTDMGYAGEGKNLWKCSQCGETFTASRASVRAYPFCRMCHGGDSHGEDTAIQVLRSAGIKFEKEKAFSDLKSEKGNPLRFDFYIANKQRQFIIEIDGQQHDGKQYAGYGGKTRQHDIIKNAYCISHHIRLYRVPYTGYQNALVMLIRGILHNEGCLIKFKMCDDKRAQSMIVTSPTDCAFPIKEKIGA